MEEEKVQKNILDKTITVFAWLSFFLALLTVGLSIFASFSGEQNGKEIFGAKMLIVTSDSMSKSAVSENEEIFFNAGDVIIIKRVKNPYALTEGEVVTFISYDPDSYGKTVTHKIREVKYNTLGDLIGYVTYGINTGENDQTLVKPESIIGIYAGKIPVIGNFFAFLKTPRGYFLSILTPCVLLIIFFSLKVGSTLGKRKLASEYEEEMEALKARVTALENKIKATETEDIAVAEDTRQEETKENSFAQWNISAKKASFAEKLRNASDEVKEYFNAVHNELLSYKKINGRVSCRCISYRFGRTLLAKMNIRGKTLVLHLALDVSQFDYNIYFQKDLSNVKAYREVPFTVKIKSKRANKNALKLIEALAAKYNASKKPHYEPIDGLLALEAFVESINTDKK